MPTAAEQRAQGVGMQTRPGYENLVGGFEAGGKSSQDSKGFKLLMEEDRRQSPPIQVLPIQQTVLSRGQQLVNEVEVAQFKS